MDSEYLEAAVSVLRARGIGFAPGLTEREIATEGSRDRAAAAPLASQLP
jgi:hypothetical protein